MSTNPVPIPSSISFEELVDYAYEYIKSFNKDVLISFQDSLEFHQSNHNKLKSYEWLKDRIGYYPIWTMKCREGLSKSDLRVLINGTLCWDRKYLFIIDPKDLETIDTYLYAWCDIHSIENFGCEEKGDEDVKAKYTGDWEGFLLARNYPDELSVQTLVKEVPIRNVLRIYERTVENINTQRLNLF